MINPIHSHPDSGVVENYSLGRLPETELEQVEEHLLICESCRELVEVTDSFVASMRAAARELRRLASPSGGLEPDPGAAVEGSAPGGRARPLQPSLPGAAAGPAYHMKFVDESGSVFWQGDVGPGTAASVLAQHPGTRFVRVYSTAGELLREYGLEVKV